MKVHILSASPRMNSGFSIVATHLATGLKKLGYDVSYSGMQTAYRPEFNSDIEILPMQVGFVDDMTQYMMTLNRIKPDIVLNIFQADYEYNEFSKLFKKCLWYVPIEGRNIPQGMANDLLQVKMNGGDVVAQCNYGKQEIELALAGLSIPVIYHGYDPEIYYPMNLDNKDDISYCYYETDVGKSSTNPKILCIQGCYNCKLPRNQQRSCEFFKEEQITVLKFVEKDGKWGEFNIKITELPEITKGKTVFGFVGQNLGIRKRIERLLKAYSLFVGKSRQLKDRTILHMHCMPIATNGVDLIKVVRELGLNNNVIFSYGTYRSSGWSDNAMSILYNTFEINISASSSEGFGLAIIESMACGKPNIGPMCSSFIELIGNDYDPSKNRGLLANIGEWQMIENMSERALVNEGDLAEKIKDIYTNDKLRRIFSKNATKWANNHTWNKKVEEWDKLLKGMT